MQYIVDSQVFVVGASGGVYALIIAHMANVILVSAAQQKTRILL